MRDTYKFVERPAQKSSTNVLINTPGKIACQLCGCRDHVRYGCQCNCHLRGVSPIKAALESIEAFVRILGDGRKISR
jgi:hypothetical protein